MTDVMVSVRMPARLVAALKKRAAEDHFLDVSELVRSIVRDVWVEHTQPQLAELQKLRQDIQDTIKQKSVDKVHHEVKKELEKIKQRLTKEELL